MLLTLIDHLEKMDIILASASPRRYELLKKLGLEFTVVPSNVREEHTLRTNIENLVRHNTFNKGMAVAQKHPDALIISADTVVALGDRILGKPKNEREAAEMLRLLSGKIHAVYTAIGLFFQRYEKSMLDVVCTRVRFRSISEEEIWAYINTGEPFDKAGAYGIQGQGALLVEGIEGCYYNVVGLPLSRLFTMLTEFMNHFVV